MAIHGHERIARISPDTEIGCFFAVGQTIEGRVCLDEPAMRLPFQLGQHLVYGSRSHVEPGREGRQWCFQVGFLENQ
jgi:hypothetical protein